MTSLKGILVSIITPAYNSSDYIRETIEAILFQSHKEWELLITDDQSEDNTCRIVEEYASRDSRIRLFRLQQNSGAAVARNYSIEKASGQFIAFCDSDDVWTPDKLEKQIRFMLENNYAFTFAPYHIIGEDGALLGESRTRPRVTYDDILVTCDIGCLTAVYDAALFGKVYMENIRRRQDYTLWLKLLKKVPYAYSYPEPLGYYRIRHHSISRNKWQAIRYIWKVYRDIEQLPMLKSFSLILQYSFYGAVKYLGLKVKKKPKGERSDSDS